MRQQKKPKTCEGEDVSGDLGPGVRKDSERAKNIFSTDAASAILTNDLFMIMEQAKVTVGYSLFISTS